MARQPSDIKDSDSLKNEGGLELYEDTAVRRPARKTLEQREQELAAALEVDPGIPKWGWAAFYMYFIVFVACCCSGDSGFDGTVMGGVNGMHQYQKYFGLDGAGAKTSIVFGVYTIGSLSAVFPAAYIPDRFGRRASMFFGNCMLIIGAGITATAKNKSTFIGGRFLTGFGAGCAGASAKSFLGELTSPQNRGLYMGFLNSFYYVGQMTATGMMVATEKYKSNWSWRLPLFVQMVPAGLNVLLVWFAPESPRWLYSVGRADEARKILARLHSATNDVNSPLINLEMEEIEEYVMIGGADKRFWDFRPLFRTSADRYRAFMVIMIGAFGQLSGNGLITYFLPILLGNAGITSQSKKLTLNFVNSVTSYAGALAGSAVVDRVGRRKLSIGATATITVMLAIIAGMLSHKNAGAALSNAGITFIFLFMVIFSFGWTAMQALYPMEVLSYEMRAKGLAFLNLVTQGSSCINTWAMPIALQKLDYKVYIIFAVWDAFETVMLYLFLVETKGLSLEQIEDVFHQPSPVKYSLEHGVKQMRGAGAA